MVINPSFEEVDNKFKTKDVYRLKLANGWSAPESSTDLYTKKSKNKVFGIPDNNSGYQDCISGDIYAGFYSSARSTVYKESIQGSLVGFYHENAHAFFKFNNIQFNEPNFPIGGDWFPNEHAYLLKNYEIPFAKSFGDNIRQHYRNDVSGVIRTTGFFRNLFRSTPIREAYRSVRFL